MDHHQPEREPHRQHAAVGQLPLEEVIKSGNRYSADHLGDHTVRHQQYPLPLHGRSKFCESLRDPGNHLINGFTTGWRFSPAPGDIARPQFGMACSRLYLCQPFKQADIPLTKGRHKLH